VIRTALRTTATWGLWALTGLGGLTYVLIGFISLMGIPQHVGGRKWSLAALDLAFVVLAPLLAWAVVRFIAGRARDRLVRYAVGGTVLVIAGCAYAFVFYLLSTPIQPIPPYRD